MARLGIPAPLGRGGCPICLNQAWQEAQRQQSPLSLLLRDIDFFKSYNDHYGHPAGDACLQQMAIALKEAVRRPQDVIAHYGGEEFAILLPQTDLSGAVAVAQQIRSTITRYQLPHQFSGVASHITLSIGVGCCPRVSPHSNPEDLVSAADHGLYSAKAEGRDRYCLGPDP